MEHAWIVAAARPTAAITARNNERFLSRAISTQGEHTA